MMLRLQRGSGFFVRSHSAFMGERSSMQATSRLGHFFVTGATVLLAVP
jgi:hypothetical protein